MDRVKEPLEEIGAKIETNNGRMPVDIFPSEIKGGSIVFLHHQHKLNLLLYLPLYQEMQSLR